MELIPEKVSACRTTMAIVDREEAASGPLVDLLELWLNDIEYYTNSILIVVSNNALMRICRIATDHTIFLTGELCRVITANIPFNLLLLHFHIFLLLLDCHDKPSIGNQLLLTFALIHRLPLHFLSCYRWLCLTVSLRLFLCFWLLLGSLAM